MGRTHQVGQQVAERRFLLAVLRQRPDHLDPQHFFALLLRRFECRSRHRNHLLVFLYRLALVLAGTTRLTRTALAQVTRTFEVDRHDFSSRAVDCQIHPPKGPAVAVCLNDGHARYVLGKRLVGVAGDDRVDAAKLAGDGEDFAAGVARVEPFGIAKIGARSPFVHDGDHDLSPVLAQPAGLLVDARGERQEGQAGHIGGQRRVGCGCGDCAD